MSIFDKQRILITGAAGTVGTELVRQLSSLFEPSEIRALDNNETNLFFLEQDYQKDPRVHCSLGDIRDRDTLKNALQDIDIVIHAAALKHVILCEMSPWDAVKTNIVGIQNLIQAALTCGTRIVLFTSSDKAVNPTNVMGTSKLMGERLMTSANAKKIDGRGPVFFSTRFGNILGSRGSVIPLFIKQIASGGPVTLTHPEMTRFIMTLTEAISLVLKSVEYARGGEVFVPKMPVVKIQDLAEIIIEIKAPHYGYKASDIRIIKTGVKAGEKLYEELMNLEETRRSIELKDMFVILPAFKSIYEQINYNYQNIIKNTLSKPYNSQTEKAMSTNELKEYLLYHKLI